jgi:hypothetical protein
MHTLHANFRSSAETHLLGIRHAVEMFLFLQHLSRHFCFRMRFSIQLMQNEPNPNLDSQVQLLRDFSQQQLPQIFVHDRITIVNVPCVSWNNPAILLPDFDPVCDAFDEIFGI